MLAANPICYSIVFIHGLQGHPEKTWTYSGKEAAKPKRFLKFTRKKQPHAATGTSSQEAQSVFWPKALLAKDFINARIMTYGYDSAVSKFFKGPSNQGGIIAHSEALLNALEVERRECRQRPITFIVHSLGGIILKRVWGLDPVKKTKLSDNYRPLLSRRPL